MGNHDRAIAAKQLSMRKNLFGVPQKVKRFTGGYFGVRRAEFFTSEFKAHVNQCESFTDLTAGTGQFPYSLAESGFPTYANDRCYYAATILQCLFNKSTVTVDHEEWVRSVYTRLLPGNMKKLEPGLLCEKHLMAPKSGRRFREDTGIYIDSVGKIIPKTAHYLRYGIGRTMLRWTFHGRRGFCTKAPDGRSLATITPEEVHAWIINAAARVKTYHDRLPDTPHAASYGDALKALDKHPIKDGFVYIDPAWPWAPQFGGGNPYQFFTDVVSSVAAAKQLNIPPWEVDNHEAILNEVTSWMERAFENGAKMFCVCTQDTNDPPGEVVYGWMRKRFKERALITLNDWSAAATRNYINWWGIYEPKS